MIPDHYDIIDPSECLPWWGMLRVLHVISFLHVDKMYIFYPHTHGVMDVKWKPRVRGWIWKINLSMDVQWRRDTSSRWPLKLVMVLGSCSNAKTTIP
jgi:hypothetical protein